MEGLAFILCLMGVCYKIRSNIGKENKEPKRSDEFLYFVGLPVMIICALSAFYFDLNQYLRYFGAFLMFVIMAITILLDDDKEWEREKNYKQNKKEK